MKKNRLKEKLIKELKEMPVIQFACKQTGISRATYYRWKSEDKKFTEEVNKAIAEGEELITDMSESQLISLIRDKNFQAVKLWLRHHHPRYNQRINVNATINSSDEDLTPEQEEIIRKALQLSSLDNENNIKVNSKIK